MFFRKKRAVKSTPERGAIKRINRLKKGNLNEESIVELNNIIKDYLRIKFKFIQSLTYEEIINKLEEKKINKAAKIDLSHLLVQIYQKEYFPHDKIESKEVEFVLNLAIKTLEEMELGKKTVKEKEVKVNEKQEKSKALEKLEEDISSLGKGFKLDWRNPEIRQKYEKIRKDYSNLSDIEKKTVYPKIISLFKLKKI